MGIQNGIYYQQQSGGLCRLHSLNGYFGKELISTEQFNKYQIDYDTEYKNKFNFDSSCKNFDIVASDQKNIVNYILKKYGVYTRYYSINQIYGKSIQGYIINIVDGDYFFVYNEGHIWGCRKKGSAWFRVDSLNGVSLININTITSEKNIGFIIPVNPQHEFYVNLTLIKSTLGETIDEKIIREYLIRQNKEKNILGCLEIPIGICMDVLETNLLKKNDASFISIQSQVTAYNYFVSKFTDGNYNNISLILEHLPAIIIRLAALKTQPRN